MSILKSKTGLGVALMLALFATAWALVHYEVTVAPLGVFSTDPAFYEVWSDLAQAPFGSPMAQ